MTVKMIIDAKGATDETLKADDKKTPEINEAWEGGKAPKKKGSTKKK